MRKERVDTMREGNGGVGTRNHRTKWKTVEKSRRKKPKRN